MSITQMDICNLALNNLGSKKITSLTESSQAAIQLSLVYDICRDSVLRDCDWQFATFFASLAAISGATELVPGYAYIYAYPTKCMRIRKVYSDNESQNPVAEDFRPCLSAATAQKAIACQLSPAYIEYTYQVTDPTLYDSKFVEALSFKLAATVCVILTGSTEKRDKMVKGYADTLSDAKKFNAIEKKDTVEKTSTTVDARA
jgi:hypothetical protein